MQDFDDKKLMSRRSSMPLPHDTEIKINWQRWQLAMY